MEKRIQPRPGALPSPNKGIDLPVDYVRMVTEIFTTHFDAAIKILAGLKKKATFAVSGKIYPDEILLSIAFVQEGSLSALSAHASSDFDPTASSPSAEELLGAGVDALASLFTELLPEGADKLIEALEAPLSAFENVPFAWTPTTVNQRKIYLRVDKSNPSLEQMTEQWLEKHDPERARARDAERENDEELLTERVKGPKRGPGGNGGLGGQGDGPIRH